MLAGEAGGGDHPLGAALAEAAGNQDAVDPFEPLEGVAVLERVGLDPFEVDLDRVGDAAVMERFDQRLIGVLEPGIFADDGDGHLALVLADRPADLLQRDRSGCGASPIPNAASTSSSRPSA